MEHNYPIIKKFNIGSSEGEITGPLKQMGLYTSNKLIDLYKWKNGVNGLYQGSTIGELALFTSGIMFPFAFAISTYILETKVQKSIKKNFFPLFTSGGGDYILMNLDKKKPSENLFFYSPSVLLSETPMTIYDSLETMFETVLLTYKNKGYYFNGDILEVDSEIERKISIELNPKSEFWKE